MIARNLTILEVCSKLSHKGSYKEKNQQLKVCCNSDLDDKYQKVKIYLYRYSKKNKTQSKKSRML
jgi:hypothetical protein